MKLSIVTTLYKSAATLDEFYQRIIAAAAPLRYEIEIVLVNDGSPDDSLGRAVAIQQRDPRVVVVDLSRNFGHHKAMMTGLAYASGDLVFLIDSDLEEDPELISVFHERWLKGDCDVVYGFQTRRKGDLTEQVTGAIYYSLVQLLSDDHITPNHLTVRLMTREYVQSLVSYQDKDFLIEQLWSSCGYRQVGVPVKKLALSPTTYSFRMKAEYLIKHLSTSSTKLLYLTFYCGTAVFTATISVIVYFLTRYAIAGTVVDGFTSIIISVWFFGGLLTLILAVHGLYIASILSESKNRPVTVVRKVFRSDAAGSVGGSQIAAATHHKG